jgi:hypothetical protein
MKTYTRVDAGTGRIKPLEDSDWPNNGPVIHLLNLRCVAACGALNFRESEITPEINEVTCTLCIAMHEAYTTKQERNQK